MDIQLLKVRDEIEFGDGKIKAGAAGLVSQGKVIFDKSDTSGLPEDIPAMFVTDIPLEYWETKADIHKISIGEVIDLIEKKSDFVASGFLFSIQNDPDAMDGFVIYINTKKCWKERECLTDCYSDEEDLMLVPVLEELGLSEMQESKFETTKQWMPKDLREELLKRGFEEDPKFDEFMKAHNDG